MTSTRSFIRLLSLSSGAPAAHGRVRPGPGSDIFSRQVRVVGFYKSTTPLQLPPLVLLSAGPQQQVLDRRGLRRGQRRTSTVGTRSQWAPSDLNRQQECMNICQIECQTSRPIECQYTHQEFLARKRVRKYQNTAQNISSLYVSSCARLPGLDGRIVSQYMCTAFFNMPLRAGIARSKVIHICSMHFLRSLAAVPFAGDHFARRNRAVSRCC